MRIACAPLVVAFGVALASTTAYAGDDTAAETATEHAKQMSEGKTHEDAVRATQPK
jgi:hypothetical protein